MSKKVRPHLTPVPQASGRLFVTATRLTSVRLVRSERELSEKVNGAYTLRIDVTDDKGNTLAWGYATERGEILALLLGAACEGGEWYTEVVNELNVASRKLAGPPIVL
jgi:hypothetical protein